MEEEFHNNYIGSIELTLLHMPHEKWNIESEKNSFLFCASVIKKVDMKRTWTEWEIVDELKWMTQRANRRIITIIKLTKSSIAMNYILHYSCDSYFYGLITSLLLPNIFIRWLWLQTSPFPLISFHLVCTSYIDWTITKLYAATVAHSFTSQAHKDHVFRKIRCFWYIFGMWMSRDSII